jgi:predicted signal transduction protein with EAL and GGDEF domain
MGPRLQASLRPTDLLARLGGDEFAMVLPDTSATEALAVARALGLSLEASFVIAGQAFSLGASIGVALAPEHGTDVDTLLQHADVAMYVAKRSELGCAVYDALTDTHSPTVLALTADLHQAIAEDQLVLHYQPQLLLQTQHVYGVEVLVRWAHPVHGLIPPDKFIPLAERTGAIIPLTAWVLDRALRQCRAWLDAGIDLSISVNISLRNLRDPELCQTLETALARYEVAPERLCLELTESMIMTDVAAAKVVLQRLAALGIRLSIDDFGTGYSSLAYIAHLPVTEVKIDRSFVQHLTTDESDAIVVASTIGLGRSLGLHSVIEGVEDAVTCDLLRAWHGDAVQGYFFSRPLPARELETWLRSWQSARQCAPVRVVLPWSDGTTSLREPVSHMA